MSRLPLYFHTLRHLKGSQIYGRMLFRLRKPKPDVRPAPPVRSNTGAWVTPSRRRPSLLSPTSCRFLNEEHSIASARAWNDTAREKLWLYNLHYFDDLNAVQAEQRSAWHRALIARWVAENPAGSGTGWEPYPLSLRIVNWIKWASAGNDLEEVWLHSLAVQARFLSQRLEWHLLGNHLFANAKALVFAGLFFKGDEASRWLDTGLKILECEIPEQILADGGQFERSTMYHALALEDMLDMLNITRLHAEAIPLRWQSLVASWPELAGRMQRWLAFMCHPDGEISFFNDAAFGIAPAPAELERYGRNLGLVEAGESDGMVHLAASGYIGVHEGVLAAMLDVAPIGPDYLPGHAHADTLSFELSLFGQRVFVNSGTSCYGDSAERLRQRGTAAHNTVVVDGQNSSEVWSGFRVARRARPYDLVINKEAEVFHVSCAHDGYMRLAGRVGHHRAWIFDGESLVVEDRITGACERAAARFHLHSSVRIEEEYTDSEGAATVVLKLPQGQKINFSVAGGRLRQEASAWHPEFGRNEPNRCLVVDFANSALRTTIKWHSVV